MKFWPWNFDLAHWPLRMPRKLTLINGINSKTPSDWFILGRNVQAKMYPRKSAQDAAFVFYKVFNAVFLVRINPYFWLAILTNKLAAISMFDETIELYQITVIGLMISLSDDIIMRSTFPPIGLNRSYRWKLLRFSQDRSFQAVLDYPRCNNIHQQNSATQDFQQARYKCEKSLGFRHLSFDQMRTDGLLWLSFKDKLLSLKYLYYTNYIHLEKNISCLWYFYKKVQKCYLLSLRASKMAIGKGPWLHRNHHKSSDFLLL